MVDMLVLAQILESALLEQSSPCNIPIRTSNMSEPCHFQRIYYTVVSMRRVSHLEARCAVGLELFLIVLNNPGKIRWKGSLLSKEWRIRKEDNRLTCREYTLDHRYSLVGWPCQIFLTNS